MATSIAFPKTAVKRPRPSQKSPDVVHCFVQSPKGNLERLAHWTAGLQIFPHSLYIELLWNTLVQQTRGRISICTSNAKFDAAKKIGPKPVHPNGVLIREVAFDARRVQYTAEKESVWHVPKPAEDDKPLIRVFGVSDGHCKPTVYGLKLLSKPKLA
jgi:hypothetical protein